MRGNLEGYGAGSLWRALGGALLVLAGACAGDEARMRHHYLHQHGIQHGHGADDEADPLRADRAPDAARSSGAVTSDPEHP